MVETQDWIHSIWALFLPLLLSPSVTSSKEILHATVPVEKNVTTQMLTQSHMRAMTLCHFS